MPSIDDIPDVDSVPRLATTILDSVPENVDLPDDAEVDRLYVIGSYGGDEATSTSDIDILVGIRSSDDLDRRTMGELQDHFSGNSGGLPKKVEFFVRQESEVDSALRTACSDKGYETVYNIRTGQFEQIL